jgi:hypothetical protein
LLRGTDHCDRFWIEQLFNVAHKGLSGWPMGIGLKGTRKEQPHSMPLYCNLLVSSTHSTFFHLDNPISFFYLLIESCA